MNKMIMGLMVSALWFAGCDTTSEAAVQTVDWYKDHPTERDAQLKKCRANPRELALTKNCINAKRATQKPKAKTNDTIFDFIPDTRQQ